MIGTILVVLLVVGLAVGGYLIYAKHKTTIDREAGRIVDQAEDVAAKAKEKVKK